MLRKSDGQRPVVVVKTERRRWRKKVLENVGEVDDIKIPPYVLTLFDQEHRH